jgi:hypothetical protein
MLLALAVRESMKLLITLLATLGVSLIATAEETWSVAEAKIKGKPVVYKFMNELPDEKLRNNMSWLTVVSWKYDGSTNNGMPPKNLNDSMIQLEDGLEAITGREKIYFDVYSATGNNLKEFVFYITDREEFMNNFNKALNGHSAYPIEINFYEDKEWSDLIKLHADFGVQLTSKGIGREKAAPML